MENEPFDDDYDDDFGEPLDDAESALVRQDLRDLEQFADTFAPEGYRGVALFCQDCLEPHYYPWEMLAENLRVLLDTGETPVHEPAFEPDPEQYIPWEYARGYVDALTDAGVQERRELDACPRCGWALRAIPPEGKGASIPVRSGLGGANFCPRCGTPLLRERVRGALAAAGLDEGTISSVLRESGLP